MKLHNRAGITLCAELDVFSANHFVREKVVGMHMFLRKYFKIKFCSVLVRNW